MWSPESSVVRANSAMRRYLVALTAGGITAIGFLGLSLVGLNALGALPPPQMSNSLCMDEKLNSMRLDRPTNPNLLVVGSSVAWRHFNAPAAIALDPSLRPYNAGFCGAKITQTEQVTRWLTHRLPSVKRVVLMASPFDFVECANSESSRFDVAEADRFVFGGESRATLYARYFDPVTLVLNARNIRAQRRVVSSLDPLVQDRFGDAPSEPEKSRGLFYGSAGELDPQCFAALNRTARNLDAAGIAFDVVLTPTQSDWNKLYGEPNQFSARLRSAVQRSLAGSDAELVGSTAPPPDDAFYDAIHFRWSSTGAYTQALLSSMRPMRMSNLTSSDDRGARRLKGQDASGA